MSFPSWRPPIFGASAPPIAFSGRLRVGMRPYQIAKDGQGGRRLGQAASPFRPSQPAAAVVSRFECDPADRAAKLRSFPRKRESRAVLGPRLRGDERKKSV
jgi:hypothetical protein